MSLVPPIKDNDWSSVRQAIQKIASIKLGSKAFPTFAGLTFTGLTASRLIATGASKALESVANLASWIAGTSNQITVANDGDGTITLSLPQDIHTEAYPLFVNTNTALSSMIMTGGAISAGTNAGTIKVAALTAMLRTGTGATDPLVRITLAEQDNITLAAVDTFYNVLLTYGTPCTIATSTGSGNGANIIGIGHCLKETDGTRHYADAGLRLSDGIRKLHQRASHLRLIEKDGGGALVSDPGTRNLYITAAHFHRGINSYDFTLKDTSASPTPDTFDYYYYNPDGSAWVKDDNSENHYTQIDNVQYNKVDTGIGLANLTSNKYTTNWVFVRPDDEHIIVVYGRTNGTLTTAQNESIPPSLPDVIGKMAILLCKIIVRQGSDTLIFENVEYFVFTPDITVDHNELAGLQGGASDEYYHLTSAEHTLISAVGGLTPTDSNFIVGNGSTWIVESGATVRTSLGLGTGDSPTFVTGTFTDLVVDTNLFKTNSATNCVGINVADPIYSLHLLGDAYFKGPDGDPGDAPTAFTFLGGTGYSQSKGGPISIRAGDGGDGYEGPDEAAGDGGILTLGGGIAGTNMGGGPGVDGYVDVVTDMRFPAGARLVSSDFLVPSGSRILLTEATTSDIAIGSYGTRSMYTEGQAANQSFVHSYFTKTGNGGDTCYIQIYGVGTLASQTNYERTFFGYIGSGTPANREVRLWSGAGGTGNVRPIKIYTGANTDQLVVATDGKVGIGLASPKTKLTIEGVLTLKEQAAADGDNASYGQIWVKTAAPNELWYTDDGGTDHQIAFV